MENKKKNGYFLLIFLFVILFVVFGRQKEISISILPDNIPKRILEDKPNYKKYPIYETERMKKMEAWEWKRETSFEIEKRKEQKGSWIAYYPVFSSPSYPEEAKKINENLEAYLKSWQEACFRDNDFKYGNIFLYTITFDVLYHSENEISIVFDFLVWWDGETRWERKEKIWEQDGRNYIFESVETDILYFTVPAGNFFLYQDSMEEDFDHQTEVSSYSIGHLEENFRNENGDEVQRTYPQLAGEGEQLEKINVDIEADVGVLLEYSKGDREDKYEVARKTEVYYDITYNDEHVLSILYKYVYYSKRKKNWFCKEGYSEDYKVSKSRFYSAVYDLDTGERIRYEDLLDSSRTEALTSLLHTIYSKRDEGIDHIFYADNPVYYLRKNKLTFLGDGKCSKNYFLYEVEPMPAITIPYAIAKQAKTDHPIWDWLLKTDKEAE